MQITVKDRQSLADIAVQYLGGVEGIFALAERNGISITARLTDGQKLDWELTDTVDATVQRIYEAHGVEPATDISAAEANTLLAATKRYFNGCIMPPPPRRDLFVVDADTFVKGWQLSNIGSQFGNGTTVRQDASDVPFEMSSIKKVKQQLATGEKVESESGQTLVRIFGNQFDDTFA